MATTPEITERAEQPYVAIKADVTMEQLSGLADQLGELFGWLAGRGVAPAGAPFFRYNVIDMDRLLDVEAGVPVARETSGDDQVLTGVLPAGRYATALFQGHPSELVGAVADLLEWADGEQLTWDVWPGEDGEHWGCRLENYLTDPAAEPDMSKWVTELSFRLAD